MEPLLAQSVSPWNSQMPTPVRPSAAVIPHFSLTETFEGGTAYSGISAGRGKFVEVKDLAPAPCIVFAAKKNRSKRTVSIIVQSASLRRSVSNVLGFHPCSVDGHLSDISLLLNDYVRLKHHLEFLHSHLPGHFETQEFRLLVEDFLLDRCVFDGLGIEQPDRPYTISQEQFRDIHERSVDTGLDVLDDSFRLGALPFDIGDDDLNALTERYSQIALSSDRISPNGLSGSNMRSTDLTLHHEDPMFAPVRAAPDQPGSYHSFSNLSVRIKGPEAWGTFPNSFDTPQNEPLTAVDSWDRFFKAGSPLRPSHTYERYTLDDSAVGLSTGGYTSLSAIEDTSMSIGLDSFITPFRARANSFHNGMGPVADPATHIPMSGDSDELISYFSERIPTKDTNLLDQETESQPVMFEGTCDNTSSLAIALHKTVLHDIPDPDQSCNARKPSWEGQSSHVRRQQLGRNLITSLNGLCRKVRDAIGKPAAGSFESSIFNHFASFMGVWDGGIRVFRQIIDNQPPRGLLEVLDCLVVASAMSTAISSYDNYDDGSMYFEFVNDMGRWRSILDPGEHPLFDRIALALWLSVSSGDPMHERADKESLAKFHEQMQGLVTLGKEHPRVPIRSVPYATRLGAIQRGIVLEEDERSRGQAMSDPVSIPIPGGSSRKRVFNESLEMEDVEPNFDGNFSISDVFDVDLFLSQSVDDDVDGAGVVDLGWNDILSTTVLLLASTAFSAFLTLATVVNRDFDSDSILAVCRRPKGYSRSCDILSHFIESVGGQQGGFHGVPLYREHSINQGIKRLSLSTMSAPSTGHMWPPSAWANQTPSSLRMRARASAASSTLHTTAVDLSHSLGAVPHPKRLRCLSANCQKTFSSVSNRNKHMREGCQHREKSGYRCRNEHCPKVLTTKWYRNTHETERCRYRGVAGQGVSDKSG